MDLNRNFGVGWGHGERASDQQDSQNYQGRQPESEAETKAVSALLAEGGYSLVLDVHSAAAKVFGFISSPLDGPQDLAGPHAEAPPLDQQMFAALSKLLRLESEWQRTPCGALQCAASERERLVCFTVETPQPKWLPLLYTKFDFSKAEALELALRICEFLVQCETISNKSNR